MRRFVTIIGCLLLASGCGGRSVSIADNNNRNNDDANDGSVTLPDAAIPPDAGVRPDDGKAEERYHPGDLRPVRRRQAYRGVSLVNSMMRLI
jgi:hypothetical protein